jgi:TIGR03009 family protein
MVRFGISLASMLAVTAVLFGQPPSQTLPLSPAPLLAPPVAPVGKPDPVLVGHLNGWEAAMKNVETFAVEAKITYKDLITKRESSSTGNIWCMKGGYARLNIIKSVGKDEKPNPADFKAYICNSTTLYEYDGAEKIVTTVSLGKSGVGNNLLLDLMSGMTAEAAMKRFDLKISKTEEPYVYIVATPKNAEDKAEFETLTLVLCDATVKGRAYIPRLVELRKANGQQTERWDFPDPKVNPAGIVKEHFEAKLPAGWRVQKAEAPKAAAPITPASNNKLPVPGGR